MLQDWMVVLFFVKPGMRGGSMMMAMVLAAKTTRVIVRVGVPIVVRLVVVMVEEVVVVVDVLVFLVPQFGRMRKTAILNGLLCVVVGLEVKVDMVDTAVADTAVAVVDMLVGMITLMNRSFSIKIK